MNPAQAELAPHLAAAFKTACLAELEALKPGNVHIFADGHGMVVQDFVHSAEAAAAVIAQPGLAVGQRILSAVESSWNAVGCNTNLGIILLCAPLLHAALHANGKPLRESLHAVLQALTVADAEYAYRAIVQASPAGLGHSARHDVRQPPRTTLLEAMREAQHIDRIAWQYVHDFTDVIEFGAARYRYFLNAWERPAWAATAVYLGFLSDYPDSHIARKHGADAASAVREMAIPHEQALLAMENPKKSQRDLLDFDAELKSAGLNPGTSADLTVASLLYASLDSLLLATDGREAHGAGADGSVV